MLCFDPTVRVTVPLALEHPWLASYHDPADEPDCPVKFEKWREIEQLETIEEFRQALWDEIEDYRNQVRGLGLDIQEEDEEEHRPPLSASPSPMEEQQPPLVFEEGIFKMSPNPASTIVREPEPMEPLTVVDGDVAAEITDRLDRLARLREAEDVLPDTMPSISPETHHRRSLVTPTDPVVTYARRSSILQPSRQGSTYSSPLPSAHVPVFVEGSSTGDNKTLSGMVPFPTQGYVVPARSRTGSTVGGEMTRKILRTLSTVSIHEHSEGLAGGLAGIAPIGKYITEVNTEADAPPSEGPKDFGIPSESEEHLDERSKKAEKKFVVG